MDLSQAIEQANAFVFPGFLTDDDSLTQERSKNEEAIKVLTDAWKAAPLGREPFSFDLVRGLADRNRDICDRYGIERLRNTNGLNLARRLSDADLIHGVATLQHRSDEEVTRVSGPTAADLGIAYIDAPVWGAVVGIDLETSDREPDRGYVINVGLEFMNLTPTAKPTNPYSAYCGMPEMYAEKGVPISEIHHITWKDLEGVPPLRQNSKMQKAILAALTAFPYMAHNAAFEDSWFMLNVDGYAEARKAGKIVPIDTRDICRRVDPEVRLLPRETHPATLENWARRRGTLSKNEKERHLGLEDVDLMLATVQAEFSERKMFPGQREED